MTDFFFELLNMSLVSCWLIIALLVVRPLLKKVPRAFVCALWGLVGLRLLCPFSFESVLSLIPSSNPVSQEVILTQLSYVSAEQVTDKTTIISNTLASPAGASINPLQAISLVAAFIWAVGFAVMLIISLVSYFRLKKSVSASLTTDGVVFINDYIASPFVLGFIKPKIYIPSSLTEYEKSFVIAHENAHIKRRDYLIKPLGYLILSLHWFNPLVWVAYIFLCRDIESACDERVISKMDDNGKKAYSEVLLKLSLPSKRLRACPVAFGEVGVKNRVKTVLNYKKPTFWICVVSVLLVLVIALGFLTNPVAEAKEQKPLTLEECISQAIVTNNKTSDSEGFFCVENYVELKTVTFKKDITAYIWAFYGEYEKTDRGVELSRHTYEPVKLTFEKTEDSFELLEYENTPDRRGVLWLYDTFPKELRDSVLYTPGYFNDQKASAYKLACAHFGVTPQVNDFYPTFNAEVVELNEKYIVVSPAKGETVSNNTFEEVRLSRKHLTPTTYEPVVGDKVRVRYSDIIDMDSDPPVLTYVLNLELLEAYQSHPYVIYSGDGGAYYIKESTADKVYVYKSGNMDLWFPGTYFALNENMETFTLIYETDEFQEQGDAYSEIKTSRLISGNYKVEGNVLELCVDNSVYGTYYCFIKDGDTYEFSMALTLQRSQKVPEDIPFETGDRFVLGYGL
ncbi:MAG: M56 family metallopeptidase [Clostridia bacterium]|nr:M56 family metallopeptidase [Clostridia bacterium]